MAGITDLPGSFAQFGGAIRGFLTLTRHGRLRDQIRDSLGLFDLAKQHPELADASADLAKVITIQAGRLLAVIEPNRPRRWDWGQFAVGIGFSAGIAWAEWAAWSIRGFVRGSANSE